MVDLPDLPYAEANVTLSPHTWYGVGGPADVVLIPKNRNEIIEAFQWIQTQSCPFLIIGSGTNVLICDKGFRGIVLITKQIDHITQTENDDYTIGSGVILDRMVREIMLEKNYQGVGALTGIPGTVGGAIFMNAGTANGSICELLDWVDILGADGVRRQVIEPGMYEYRHQSFNKSGEIILAGGFHFDKSEEDQLKIYEHYIERRRTRQPSGRCCGSVFKNPQGDHAGRLIEACGLKGQRKGGAVISPVHGNFIMNDSSATYEDILFLMRLCRDRVREKFGVELEPEVKIVADNGLLGRL